MSRIFPTLIECPSRRRFGSTRIVGMLALCIAAGCGGNSMTKQVEGIVTFEGKTPPAAGKITLAPIEAVAPFPRRAASGDFDESGKFVLTTFETGDGIIPGRYIANIACWREVPTLETKLSANYVPPNFKHEVTIDVDASEPIELRIDVPTIQRGQ